MKNLIISASLAVLLAACASKETINYISSSELLAPHCKEEFIKRSSGLLPIATAISPITYYNGRPVQACGVAESGYLRSAKSRMEYALSQCEVSRANGMKKAPGLVVEPCRPFMP